MIKDFNYFDTLLPQAIGSKIAAIAPVVTSSAAFGYQDAYEAEAIFDGKIQKPFYARMGNPTNAKLESVMAKIDGGFGAIATSSGMGAISMVLTALLKAGDRVLCVGGFFGGTYALMSETLPRFEIEPIFCDADDYESMQKELDRGVSVVLCESVGNPNLKLPDLKKISGLCEEFRTLFVVDNTATPLVVRPLELGADVAIYSTTKNISGHSASLGGIAVFSEVNKKCKLHAPKYDHLHKIVQKSGKAAFIAICKKRALRDFGMSANAFGSFLTLLGLETLSIRMKRIFENVEYIVSALENELPKGVVRHPSLLSHEHHTRYKRLYPLGCGSLFTLRLKDKQEAFDFLNNSKLLTQTANIGDNRTLALHMKSTIYRDFDEKSLKILGITDGLIRFSSGIENPQNIVDDILDAFSAVGK